MVLSLSIIVFIQEQFDPLGKVLLNKGLKINEPHHHQPQQQQQQVIHHQQIQTVQAATAVATATAGNKPRLSFVNKLSTASGGGQRSKIVLLKSSNSNSAAAAAAQVAVRSRLPQQLASNRQHRTPTAVVVTTPANATTPNSRTALR